MKKYLFLILLSLAPWVKADMLCNYVMDVIIQNQTGAQCRLINLIIQQGNSRAKTIPLVIDNNEQSKPYTIETDIAFLYEEAAIDLTYLCGEEKMVTFSSKKSIDKYGLYNKNTLSGNPSSFSNMDADYVVVPQSCYSKKPTPDTIIWTLR